MLKKIIMLVDDAEFMKNMVGDMLIKGGYEYITAANTEEAIEVYIEKKPDIVLVDIVMPGKNPQTEGIRCVQEISKINSNAVIAMLSAYITPLTFYASIAAGAEDIIKKPFDNNILLEKIEQLLSDRRMYRMVDIKSHISEFDLEYIFNQTEIDNIIRSTAFTLNDSFGIYENGNFNEI